MSTRPIGRGHKPHIALGVDHIGSGLGLMHSILVCQYE